MYHDFDSFDIGDDGAKKLASAIAYNKSITRLDLSSNAIADAGGAALAEALGLNSSLLVMNISDNRMKHVAGDAFAIAMAKNKIIQKLPLNFNDFSFQAYNIVKSRLRENRGHFQTSTIERIQREIGILEQVILLTFPLLTFTVWK